MIKNPWDSYLARSKSGMSAYVRHTYPTKWKKSLEASFPAGFRMGENEPGVYIGRPERVRGLARKQYAKRQYGLSKEQKLENKRAYNSIRRAEFLARGLTSTGLPRKGGPRKLTPVTSRRKWRVYPLPAPEEFVTAGFKIGDKEQQAGPMRGHINWCPNCGEHLEPYTTVVSKVEQDRKVTSQ